MFFLHQLLLAPFGNGLVERIALQSFQKTGYNYFLTSLFTSGWNNAEHNSLDFDENGYGEANHDEQLNISPLDSVSHAALFMNNSGYIYKDQEGFVLCAAASCFRSHTEHSSWSAAWLLYVE